MLVVPNVVISFFVVEIDMKMQLRFEQLESKDLLTGPPAPADNLGSLTSWAIHELDFDQGHHASDPSGDGLGKDGVEERVGLANLFGRGNLQATVDFLADSLDAPD